MYGLPFLSKNIKTYFKEHERRKKVTENMGLTFINHKILVDVWAYIKCMNYYLAKKTNF